MLETAQITNASILMKLSPIVVMVDTMVINSSMDIVLVRGVAINALRKPTRLPIKSTLTNRQMFTFANIVAEAFKCRARLASEVAKVRGVVVNAKFVRTAIALAAKMTAMLRLMTMAMIPTAMTAKVIAHLMLMVITATISKTMPKTGISVDDESVECFFDQF